MFIIIDQINVGKVVIQLSINGSFHLLLEKKWIYH